MSLDIKIHRRNDGHGKNILTVELGGSLDTATAAQLETQLKSSLSTEVKDLIFDLSKLNFISSAGLRIFAAVRKTMKAQGGEPVAFVNLQPQIKEVFEIVQSLPGVSIFSSVAEFDNYIAARQRKATGENE
jgi:anti-sigma B factor antagonist